MKKSPSHLPTIFHAAFASLAMSFIASFASAQAVSDDECVLKGGKTQCTAPVWRVTQPPAAKQDSEGFQYGVCSETTDNFVVKHFCIAQGGSWSDVTACSIPWQVTNDNMNNVVDTYIHMFVESGDCGSQKVSDSYWGAPEANPQCTSSGPERFKNGQVVFSSRVMVYTGRNKNTTTGQCGPSEWQRRIFANKDRALVCPTGYKGRNLANGDLECFIPPPCDTCRGNPVDVGNGTKRQSEIDYRAPYEGGLEMGRYYNSTGKFSTSAARPNGSHFWRHTYDRRIVPTPASALDGSGQPYVMAAASRHDGIVQYFRPNGTEIHNTRGGGNKLEQILDAQGVLTGWKYTSAQDEIETYDSRGRLVSITTRSGLVYTLAYASPVVDQILSVGHGTRLSVLCARIRSRAT